MWRVSKIEVALHLFFHATEAASQHWLGLVCVPWNLTLRRWFEFAVWACSLQLYIISAASARCASHKFIIFFLLDHDILGKPHLGGLRTLRAMLDGDLCKAAQHVATLNVRMFWYVLCILCFILYSIYCFSCVSLGMSQSQHTPYISMAPYISMDPLSLVEQYIATYYDHNYTSCAWVWNMMEHVAIRKYSALQK
jgi:hypothetical protein